eukprot:CAMPEP_0170600830 /NCGR_PEP_ID=MMETSP0224-20130122/17539_1 /TAXON_ID=285029 /ORGANISM="Togula jolla, Strain CCCM 725" /LENGTH=248 /DNA_ID=CAMNT_0010925573 /DNA_START=66 /DNA_END=809 /DNA_ORIENTATION=+
MQLRLTWALVTLVEAYVFVVSSSISVWKALRPGAADPHRPSGAVVFLHGLGDDNGGMARRLNETSGGLFQHRLESENVELFMPDAPVRNLPDWWGSSQPAWFDLAGPLTMDAPEQTASAAATYDEVLAPILAELSATVGLHKVVIGGYSMGAEMALEMLQLAPPNIAGIFSMSGYLKETSAVWEALKTGQPRPPVWMGHGTDDDSVPFENGMSTYQRLTASGVDVTWFTMPGTAHDLNSEELSALIIW